MTLNSRSLAVTLFVILFGGIAFSSVMGWWVTESTRKPITFAEGEFAGQANPVDIRGSYTFEDIEKSFNVTPEVLAKAFGIVAGDPAVFAVKDLAAIYPDSEVEIGTSSVRLFVAYYTGLPFDTTGQDIYIPQSAMDILLANENLTAERIAYLKAHTTTASGLAPADRTGDESIPLSPATPVSASEDYVVKGKTTFGELLGWGISQETIEELIGTSLPEPATKVKDYATAQGLDFETLKTSLQIEVDKVNP